MIADTGIATFPPSVRLRTPKQFQATFSQGRRISAALFRLHVRLDDTRDTGATQSPARRGDPVSERDVRPAETFVIDIAQADATNLIDAALTPARLGISVSKRVAAHAVERNRIKRIARDSFRRLRTQLPPGDYVLLAQRDAAGAPSTALRAALSALWQRALALKPAPAAPTIPLPAQDTAAGSH